MGHIRALAEIWGTGMETQAIEGKIDIEPVVDWLVAGAPGAPLSQDILLRLAEKMLDARVLIDRVAVFVTTLHPNVMGRGFFWRSGWTEVEVSEADFELLSTDLYASSPVFQVFKTGEPVRRLLCDDDCPMDFNNLADLREEGITDYYMFPLKFTDGLINAASFATRRPGGFSDTEMAAIQRIEAPLTLLAEVMAVRRVSVNILNAYLGHQSGAKVLAGNIKRGDGEDIHAVIWFCDLRGSTPLADSMSRADFLALLNDYFECLAGAVLDGQGEVLRYIGDAALAIFPVNPETQNMAAACELAVAAAQDAIARMAALNERRVADGADALGYGIGLHLGDVMYGNIGTPERIEFSVIGAAANEAARIEGKTKDLGVNFVISEDVEKHLPEGWVSQGKHALRGVGAEMELFTPPQ
jgi:adenylate cyclase